MKPNFLHGSPFTVTLLIFFVWLGSIVPIFSQEECQAPVYFIGEPESGFCSGQLPVCTTILGTTITQSSQIPSGVLSGTICIEGNFTINAGIGFTFIDATILISPNVEIIIEPIASLTLDNASLHGCNGLWNGIKLLNNSAIFTLNNTRIEDARKAINASFGSAFISLQNTTFNRNYTGIWMEASATATNPPVIANLYNTNFFCDAPIVGTVKEISDHGIYSLNCPVSFQNSNEEDDHDVNFRNLKYGIKIEGDKPADLVGKRFTFREIRYAGIYMRRGKVSLKDSHFINYGDNGILINGLHGLSLDHCEFLLNELDPKFFPAPSYPATWRFGVALGWDYQFPNLVAEVNILNKCNFAYNCPGIDEIYIGLALGGFGAKFNATVYDNDFTTIGQNARGLYIPGDYDPGSTAEIFLNRFTNFTPLPPELNSFTSYGISTYSNVNHLHIVGNVFNGGGEKSDLTHYLVNVGIDISQSKGFDNQVTSNRFYGQLWSGLSMTNSNNWKICSNRGFFVNRVFLFDGDNLSLNITQNVMAFGGFDVGGKVHVQEQKDNTFASIIFAVSYARCYTGNCWSHSRFFVRQPLGTEFYPTQQICGTGTDICTSGNEFFKNQMGTAPGPCADEFQNPGDEDLLLSIASGNISEPNEYPAKLWAYRNHLYAKLKADSVLLASNISFQTFLQNQATTSLGQFFEVKKLIQEAISGTGPGIDAQKLQVASDLNSNIVTASTFELNQQTVNQILLGSLLNQGGELNAQQVVALEQVAAQCPMEGGDAVVQAASILKGCNVIGVDIHQNCGQVNVPPLDLSGGTEERFGNQEAQEATGSLLAFSANNILTVNFPEGQSGMFYLFDISGKECFKRKISSNEEILQMDLTPFHTGLYLIAFDGESRYSAKIVISH